MQKILVLGGVAYNTMIYVDSLPPPVPQTVFSERFHETVGSTGAGKALNLHPLGLDVLLHGLVGKDENGRKLQAYLANHNIPFISDCDPDGTKHHVNLMDSVGQRISIHVVPGTFEPEINWTAIEPHIAKADVIFMSSDALPAFRPFMMQQIDNGKALVICTHGRNGATALTSEGHWIEVPIIDDFERVDTNGAGDSFFAGVVYGRSHSYPIEKCLRFGTIVSGLCISSTELAHDSLSEEWVERLFQKYYEVSPAGG